MERKRCNMPYVPLASYECDKLHRQINCNKLSKILEEYRRSPQGKYLTKMNVRHNLACFPNMRIMEYILATSNFGTRLNPYSFDFNLKCLGSWRNPELFMALLFNQLKNDPFKKIFTPFINKPFDEYPFGSYGTALKWPTKGEWEKLEALWENISNLYDTIAGDPEHLYAKNVATQTIVKQDDNAITEQKVREAFPFLRKIYSDETLQLKPYNTRERIERARSLFTVYYHTPFDTKNIQNNIMRTAFSESTVMDDTNKTKLKKKRPSRKSYSVWQTAKRMSGKNRIR